MEPLQIFHNKIFSLDHNIHYKSSNLAYLHFYQAHIFKAIATFIKKSSVSFRERNTLKSFLRISVFAYMENLENFLKS